MSGITQHIDAVEQFENVAEARKSEDDLAPLRLRVRKGKLPLHLCQHEYQVVKIEVDDAGDAHLWLKPFSDGSTSVYFS